MTMHWQCKLCLYFPAFNQNEKCETNACSENMQTSEQFQIKHWCRILHTKVKNKFKQHNQQK